MGRAASMHRRRGGRPMSLRAPLGRDAAAEEESGGFRRGRKLGIRWGASGAWRPPGQRENRE